MKQKADSSKLAAMGDIDEAASAIQVPGAAKDQGGNIGSIDDAAHGGINSTYVIEQSDQTPGSSVEMVNNSFNDDVAQYLKGDQKELARVRGQAFNAPVPDANNVPPLLGKQDSDPKEG